MNREVKEIIAEFRAACEEITGQGKRTCLSNCHWHSSYTDQQKQQRHHHHHHHQQQRNTTLPEKAAQNRGGNTIRFKRLKLFQRSKLKYSFCGSKRTEKVANARLEEQEIKVLKKFKTKTKTWSKNRERADWKIKRQICLSNWKNGESLRGVQSWPSWWGEHYYLGFLRKILHLMWVVFSFIFF